MSDGISCKVCKAMIDCPKDEVDKFVKSLSEHLLSNSSAISALDLCHPCLQDTRNRIKEDAPRFVPQVSVDYNRLTAV